MSDHVTFMGATYTILNPAKSKEPSLRCQPSSLVKTTTTALFRCCFGTTTTEPPPATASRFLAFKRNWFITFKIVNMATLVFPLPVGAHTWSNSLRFPQNTPTKRTIGNLRTARCFLLKLRTNIFSVCSSKAHLYTSGRVSDWSCTIKQRLSILKMLLRLTLHGVELGGTWEGLLAPGGQFGPRNWSKVGSSSQLHKVTVSTVSRHLTKESNPQGSLLDA